MDHHAEAESVTRLARTLSRSSLPREAACALPAIAALAATTIALVALSGNSGAALAALGTPKYGHDPVPVTVDDPYGGKPGGSPSPSPFPPVPKVIFPSFPR